MIYIYTATRIFTFFGSVLRAFWEHIVCRICKIPVEDVRVFKVNELCGHIEHEMAENLRQSFLICFVPYIMNFLLGCSFLLTGSYRLFFVGDVTTAYVYALVWLGLSCLANCIPSFEDMLCFKDFLFSCKNKAIKVILMPFFGVVYAGAYLERYSLTFVLSVAFTVLFPWIFNLSFPTLDYFDQMVF